MKSCDRLDQVDKNQETNNANTQWSSDQKMEINRDQIIIKEIDAMFSSIRDHQGSNAKAKGEHRHLTKRQKKRSGSWGYSSAKRHVKAKVMEMPFAEDYSTLAKKVGIEQFNNSSVSTTGHALDDCAEKVFVRIDDYLNKEVSKVLERSYSVDYLNHCTGPRTRIRYIKINGHVIETEEESETFNVHGNNKTIGQQGDHQDPNNFVMTEYRSAPYDLRYWSILKLLEDERKAKQPNTTSMPYLNQQIPEELAFISKSTEKLTETEQKDMQKTQQEYLVNDSSPKYIIKEKTTTKKAVLKKIDDELEKIEQDKIRLAKSVVKNKSSSIFKFIVNLF